jgi:hypothetical protein
MKKVKKIFLLGVALFFLGCSYSSHQSENDNLKSLEGMITKFATNEYISNEDLIKSHFLLTDLVLTDSLISLIEESMKMEADSLKYLMSNYLLWKQTQETKFKKGFIHNYPLGKRLISLNDDIRNSNYRVVVSPLQTMLSYFAIDDEQALIKLIKSIPDTDGANSDELDNQLLNIFNVDKNRFINIVEDLGLKTDEILIDN